MIFSRNDINWYTKGKWERYAWRRKRRCGCRVPWCRRRRLSGCICRRSKPVENGMELSKRCVLGSRRRNHTQDHIQAQDSKDQHCHERQQKRGEALASWRAARSFRLNRNSNRHSLAVIMARNFNRIQCIILSCFYFRPCSRLENSYCTSSLSLKIVRHQSF